MQKHLVKPLDEASPTLLSSRRSRINSQTPPPQRFALPHPRRIAETIVLYIPVITLTYQFHIRGDDGPVQGQHCKPKLCLRWLTVALVELLLISCIALITLILTQIVGFHNPGSSPVSDRESSPHGQAPSPTHYARRNVTPPRHLSPHFIYMTDSRNYRCRSFLSIRIWVDHLPTFPFHFVGHV